MSGLRVERVTPEWWATVRALRLAALADAPGAFASTLARERSFNDDEWRRRVTEGHWWLVHRDDRPAGLVAATVDGRDRHLLSLWVAPDHRGRGVGEALVAAVGAWAREEGASGVVLWVTDANSPARALYARLGYRPTGRRQPLPSDPTVGEHELRLDLEARPEDRSPTAPAGEQGPEGAG